MERMTFDGNFCDIAMCRENPCPYDGACTQRQVWERLKKYEDAEQDGRLVVLPCGTDADMVQQATYRFQRVQDVRKWDFASDCPVCDAGDCGGAERL